MLKIQGTQKTVMRKAYKMKKEIDLKFFEDKENYSTRKMSKTYIIGIPKK